MISRGQLKGVLEVFSRSQITPDPEWMELLESLAGQAAIAVENFHLFSDLQRSNIEINIAYDATLEGWAKALELRDKETQGHTYRVVGKTVELAQKMGVDESQMVHVRRGALLHDIGKLAIPDSILFKPGPLSQEEWRVMREHPVYAYQILSPIPNLRKAIDIPYCHHERWDGTGYPRGLKGDKIPLAARIFAVVDVWDALRSDRPYRQAWPEQDVYAHLREQSGKQFDPRAVQNFLDLVK
jgi:HD-GYP domain-containing protein (c-di-GMP phosphodiesterase class II)